MRIEKGENEVFLLTNRAGSKELALQSIDTAYSLLQPLFCITLFNPAIVLVK